MKRAIFIIGGAVTTLLLSGTIPAFAMPLDEPEIGGPFPAAPAVQTTGDGVSTWIIGLIVAAGVLALTVALFGTFRHFRSRTRAVAAGA